MFEQRYPHHIFPLRRARVNIVQTKRGEHKPRAHLAIVFVARVEIDAVSARHHLGKQNLHGSAVIQQSEKVQEVVRWLVVVTVLSHCARSRLYKHSIKEDPKERYTLDKRKNRGGLPKHEAPCCTSHLVDFLVVGAWVETARSSDQRVKALQQHIGVGRLSNVPDTGF